MVYDLVITSGNQRNSSYATHDTQLNVPTVAVPLDKIYQVWNIRVYIHLALLLVGLNCWLTSGERYFSPP